MMPMPTKMIAAVMALDAEPQSLAALDELVSSGILKGALIATVGRIAQSPDERRWLLSRIVAESTFKRRKVRLSPRESARTERLARTFSMAWLALGTEAEARTFLTTGHPLLRQRTLLEVSLTELGARRVEALLCHLRHGTVVEGETNGTPE